jgi:hypothetical protein
MKLSERASAAGVDLNDPKYVPGDGVFRAGEEWCPWCHAHGVTRPRPVCDIQQAEAEQMREAGLSVAKCSRCRNPYEGDTPAGRLCPTCQGRDDEAAKRMPHRRGARSSALYVDDGHGCVERATFAEIDAYPEWFRAER